MGVFGIRYPKTKGVRRKHNALLHHLREVAPEALGERCGPPTAMQC